MKSQKIIDIINNNVSFIKLMPQSIKEKIINDANDLVNGKICFNSAWDMERCDQEYALVNNKSYYTPNGDPEWVYMYSRLEFLHKLVLAFILDKNEKYIKSYFYYVNNFFEQNNSKNGALKVYKNDIISKVYLRINRIYRTRILHLPERYACF